MFVTVVLDCVLPECLQSKGIIQDLKNFSIPAKCSGPICFWSTLVELDSTVKPLLGILKILLFCQQNFYLLFNLYRISHELGTMKIKDIWPCCICPLACCQSSTACLTFALASQNSASHGSGIFLTKRVHSHSDTNKLRCKIAPHPRQHWSNCPKHVSACEEVLCSPPGRKHEDWCFDSMALSRGLRRCPSFSPISDHKHLPS